MHSRGWYENEVGRVEKLPQLILNVDWQKSLTAIDPQDSAALPPRQK